MKNLLLICCAILVFAKIGFSQNIVLQGYTFAENNEGYLNQVKITILKDGKVFGPEMATDEDGKFRIQLPKDRSYDIVANKAGFEEFKKTISTATEEDIIYVKFKMIRLPGYILEGTISEFFEPDTTETKPQSNAIENAKIEIFNLTEFKEVLVLENHPLHTFSIRLEQGNEYVILIRKKGYFNKRMKANVNINGCILCFEGMGTITPGVVDNLTAENTKGTLGANITMKKIIMNESIQIRNIYYDLGKWNIRKDAKDELNKLVKILNENPQIVIEIGSHTDARGNDSNNEILSKKRAKSAVEYVISKGINENRVSGKGYGESSLLNKCKDGIECSEAEHQENRRTEFKVTGYIDSRISNWSLRQIMVEENMDKIVEDLEGSYYEAPIEEKPEIIEEEPESPILEEVTEPEQTKEVIESEGSNELASIEETPLIVEETEKPKSINELPASSKIVSKDPFKDYVDKENTVVNEDSAPEYVKEPKTLAKDFSGYMVEIKRSKKMLPLNSPIFSEYGNIKVFQNKNNDYSYLIGDFKKEAKAKNYLNSYVKPRLKEAKVVLFEFGVRVK